MEITLQTNKTYLVQKVIPVVEKRGLEPLDEVLLVSGHWQSLKHRIRCSQALASHVRGSKHPQKQHTSSTDSIRDSLTLLFRAALRSATFQLE